MTLTDDRLLYTVEASLLVGILGFWGLVLVVRVLARSRPELRLERPLLAAAVVRFAAVAVLSSSSGLAALRGPDERTFANAAIALDGQPLGGAWLSSAVHELQTTIFALQFRLLGTHDSFSLRIVQVFIAVSAIAILAAAAYDLAGPMAARVVGWIAALEPSGVFFSGVLHKESFEMLGEALVVFGGVRLWRRRDWQSAIPIAVGCALAAAARPYAGAALVAGALALAVHAGFRRLGPHRRRAGALSLAAAVALVVAIGLAGSSGILDNLQRAQDVNTTDASNLRLDPVDVSTPGAAALAVPGRVVDLVTRPRPWQVANWSQRLGVLGTLTFWALLAGVMLGALADRAALRRRLPVLLYPLVGLTVVYALSVGNAGTGFRYRTHLVLLLIVAAGVLVARRRAPGEESRVAARATARRRPSWLQRRRRARPAPRPGYRPALDGVRAAAVLAVIAYHFGAKAHGGFLGVDVFFVLSGYLITTLLVRERARSGTISLPRFWARRARRLLPALLLVIAAVAVWIHQDADLAAYAARRGDLLATLFYSANWHFIAADEDYFAAYLGASPLRHAWSLAIEEQFYVVWPLVVLGAASVARHWRAALLAIIGLGTATSAIAMAAVYDPANPTRAYFGTDTRVHVLMVGAALAWLVHERPAVISSERARRLAAVVGPLMAALVLVAFLGVSDGAAAYYWGGSLLLAVVVAVGLWAIEAAPASFLARALSLEPVRWTGQISYGLYLWHWPVLLWMSDPARVGTFTPRVRQLVELGLTFALASASYYLVERPVREGRVPWLGLSVRRLAVVTTAAVAAVALLSLQATRIAGDSALARQIDDHASTTCPEGSPTVETFAWCERVAPSNPDAPVLASTGDSTSLALKAGLEEQARRHGWGFVQAGHNGCSFVPLPFAAENVERAASRAECVRLTPRVQASVTARYRRVIWIVSDRVAQLALDADDGPALAPGDPARDRILHQALLAALDRLAARRGHVVLLSTPPAGQAVSCELGESGSASCRNPSTLASDPRTEGLNAMLARIAQERPRRATFVETRDVVCPTRPYCAAAADGELIRYDGVHYTDSFSRSLSELIVRRAVRGGAPLPDTRIPAE